MLNLLVTLTRVGVVIFWIAALLSVARIIPTPIATWILWAAGIIFLAHLLEYVLVRPKFAKMKGKEISFVMTLIFGLTHWLPMLTEEQDQ